MRAKRIFATWEFQLNRGSERQVALVSPMVSFLTDLHSRAIQTSGKAEDFYEFQIKNSSKEFPKFYEDFCTEMKLEIIEENGIIERNVLKSIDYLRWIFYKQI